MHADRPVPVHPAQSKRDTRAISANGQGLTMALRRWMRATRRTALVMAMAMAMAEQSSPMTMQARRAGRGKTKTKKSRRKRRKSRATGGGEAGSEEGEARVEGAGAREGEAHRQARTKAGRVRYPGGSLPKPNRTSRRSILYATLR